MDCLWETSKQPHLNSQTFLNSKTATKKTADTKSKTMSTTKKLLAKFKTGILTPNEECKVPDFVAMDYGIFNRYYKEIL